MKQQYKDETFLARWVENNLSANELKEFENSDSYQKFKRINDSSLLLAAPYYDINALYNKTISKVAPKIIPKKVPSTFKYIAIVVVILIIFIFV